jgi:hypothetical protein
VKASEAFAAWCDGQRVEVDCGGWCDVSRFRLDYTGLSVSFHNGITEVTTQAAGREYQLRGAVPQ